MRVTIVDLSESGYIANVIGPGVNLAGVPYRNERGTGLVATGDNTFMQNTNEFGTKN